MYCVTSEKSTISSNFESISSALHAEDGAVHVDVLTTGQFRMEACPHFEQGTHAPTHGDRAACRIGDAGEDLEQGAFPCAVAPHNAEHFPFLKVEGDIFQRPNEILIGAAVGFADQCLYQLNRRGEGIHDHVAQHVVAKLRLRRADDILLAEIFYRDRSRHLDQVRECFFRAAEIKQASEQDQHGDGNRNPQRGIRTVA